MFRNGVFPKCLSTSEVRAVIVAVQQTSAECTAICTISIVEDLHRWHPRSMANVQYDLRKYIYIYILYIYIYIYVAHIFSGEKNKCSAVVTRNKKRIKLPKLMFSEVY